MLINSRMDKLNELGSHTARKMTLHTILRNFIKIILITIELDFLKALTVWLLLCKA